MNIVIDEAAEVYVKDAKPRRELGKPLQSFHLSERSNLSNRPYPTKRRQYNADPASGVNSCTCNFFPLGV